MRHDDCSRADVDFVFDNDCSSSQFGLAAFTLNGFIGAAEHDVLADVNSAANADVGGIFDSTIRADESIVANVNVVAVIAMERVNNNDLRSNTTRTG